MRVFPRCSPVQMAGAASATVALVVVLSRTFGWAAATGIGVATAGLSYLAYRVVTLLLERTDRRRHDAQQMSNLHVATVEALALAIDARGGVGQPHFWHGRIHAAAIAEALGMSETETQGVKTAALLRDIGKLAVPDHILSKSGPLTQEEFHKIRRHPQVGADIIGGVPFPYPVAHLIRCHHERWDGNGYPAGLRGDDIPLGARILSAVDYFDALISERPHRQPLAADAALTVLRQESGKALDPRVVQAFVSLYPALSAQQVAGNDATAGSSTGTETCRPPDGLADPAASRSTVFHEIALAQREVSMLYEIAQAVGSSLGVTDTMALIASKLNSLVPFSSCALFLRANQAGALRCAFATGVESDVIKQITMPYGQGLHGWVARHRRPIVNGRPRADLDAAGHKDRHTALESALVCPLIFEGRCIGSIAVYHVQPAMYDDNHRRLLDLIAERAAAAIRHSLVFEQTQEDSLTDPLTGLPNTRFMVMHLKRELSRASRLQSEVSLLVMDLDEFKDINDTYGHQVGDRALREVGGALQAAIRPYDICVRYAGDEFIAVLSGCGRPEAERKRADVQRAIAELRFEPRPGERRTLAMSAGAAVYPHDGDSYEALLVTADGRMYQNKTRRKRSVEESQPLSSRDARRL